MSVFRGEGMSSPSCWKEAVRPPVNRNIFLKVKNKILVFFLVLIFLKKFEIFLKFLLFL